LNRCLLESDQGLLLEHWLDRDWLILHWLSWKVISSNWDCLLLLLGHRTLRNCWTFGGWCSRDILWAFDRRYPHSAGIGLC
jgi:hypothetical protein